MQEDNYFSIWGVPSGFKSSDANKWNKISENDLAVFTKNNSLIGFSLTSATTFLATFLTTVFELFLGNICSRFGK